MTERVDQQICIKFCFKLGHLSAETIPIINKAFRDDSMSEAQIKLWYRHFKDGPESVESDQRSGRPSTSKTPENVESIRAAINKNRRLTVRELEEDLGIPQTIVSQILTEDLGKKCVVAKFVSRLLSREQKEFRPAVAQDLLDTANNNPDFLKKVIIEDESWVYGYDPETKSQSSQWKSPESPHPKKAWQSRSNVKVTLTSFFHHVGVVHHEYAPPGQTITKDYYIEFLRWLRDAVRRKRQQLWASGDWNLHHDNVPAHSSSHVQTSFGKISYHSGLSAPLQPRFGSLRLLAFLKTETAIEGEEISDRKQD